MVNISGKEALQRLIDGNRRFVQDIQSADVIHSTLRHSELLEVMSAGQKPFAVILGCSDARVPSELVFDQGLGSLFVIRVAGNILAPSQIGSVEFAVSRFDLPLVVIMGHTTCGVVTAAVERVLDGENAESRNVDRIVDRITPVVRILMEAGLSGDDRDKLIHAVGRAHVRFTADHLRHSSEIIESRIREGRLSVVGAECNLMTGMVDFLDDVA